MSTEEPPKIEKRSWIRTTLKVVFFTVAFLLVIFTVMTNMGGNGDVFKETIEDYVSESTGFNARIGQFNGMTFFPVLGIDFDLLDLHASADSEPVASVSKVQVAFSFWDVIWGTGKIKYLNIEGAYAAPGVLLREEFRLDRAAIVKTEDGASALRAAGRIGANEFIAQAGMQSSGEGKGESFRFSEEKPFFANLGPARIEGVLKEGDEAAFIENFRILFQDQDVLRINGSMQRAVGSDVAIKGDIVLAERQTALQPDLILRHDGRRNYNIEGTVKSATAYSEDFNKNSRLMNFLKFVDSVFMNNDPDEIRFHASFIEAMITLVFDRMIVDGDDSNAFERKIEMKNADIVIRPQKPFMEIFSIEQAVEPPAP